MGGWVGGWVGVKAVLRIAYSNQKQFNDSVLGNIAIKLKKRDDFCI
jgi:hypothetical protein